MRDLFSLFFVASALLQAQGPVPPATKAGMTSFRDDSLRLSYSYPANYTDATALVTSAFQASLGSEGGAKARCIELPLARSGPDKGQLSLVLLVRADAACLKRKFDAKSVAELTAGEAQGLAASGATTRFSEPSSFAVAGRPASAMEGSFTLPTGQTLQARVVCVLDKPDMACWQFLASTPEALRSMGQFPVTFDGSPATLLAPGQGSSQ